MNAVFRRSNQPLRMQELLCAPRSTELSEALTSKHPGFSIAATFVHGFQCTRLDHGKVSCDVDLGR